MRCMALGNARAALVIMMCTWVGFAACSGDTEPGEQCGDSARGGEEVCDGTDLGGATCESVGFGAGTLKCEGNCRDFDRSACGVPASCGNGVKDTVEICDGADLAGATCVGLGYGAGTLACKGNCGNFDVSGCGTPLSCGNRVKDGAEACDG